MCERDISHLMQSVSQYPEHSHSRALIYLLYLPACLPACLLGCFDPRDLHTYIRPHSPSKPLSTRHRHRRYILILWNLYHQSRVFPNYTRSWGPLVLFLCIEDSTAIPLSVPYVLPSLPTCSILLLLTLPWHM